jgi:hypothetical protein
LSTSDEIILTQEQSATRKADSGEKIQGTLVLTDKRLLFVVANKEEDIGAGTLRYADVDDLKNIPASPHNLSVTIASIERVSGSEGIIHTPELKIDWKENGELRHTEFFEEIFGGRKKDLRDWAKVIEGLRAGKISINRPRNPPPSMDTLEGKILNVLGDMQEKGVFEIEEEVETTFQIDSDPDQVEAACDKLVDEGLLDKTPDKSGDNFYRKRSPLSEDDLSS